MKPIALLALSLLCLLFIPRGCRDLRDTRMLEQSARTTQGVVLQHRRDRTITMVSAACRHALADIGYRVDGQEYAVTARGCGADALRLPAGSAVEVRYAAQQPTVAEAVVPETESTRMGMGGMAALLLVTAFWLLLLLL